MSFVKCFDVKFARLEIDPDQSPRAFLQTPENMSVDVVPEKPSMCVGLVNREGLFLVISKRNMLKKNFISICVCITNYKLQKPMNKIK